MYVSGRESTRGAGSTPAIESLRKKTTRGPPFGKLCHIRTRKAYQVLPNLVTLSSRDVRFNEN